MGRLFSLIAVVAIMVPFFAAAGQVDDARRQRLAAIEAQTGVGPTPHFACRLNHELCDDDIDQ